MTFTLATGETVAVDDADEVLVSNYSWHIGGRGYVKHSYREGGRVKSLYLHTLLTGFRLVDHQDRNTLNNRRGNIREADGSKNGANKSKHRYLRTPTSQFKGVSWNKARGKWKAYLGGSSSQHVGYFSDEVEAAKARDAAASERYGAFAYLNVPDVIKGDGRTASKSGT